MRRLTGPVGKGIHRIVWDLRYPAVEPVMPEAAGPREDFGGPPQGPLVVPGTFTVLLAKRVEGVVTSVGEPQKFSLESLGLASLPENDKGALLDFQNKAGELQRAMMGAGSAAQEAVKSLRYMKKALLDTPKADPALGDRSRALEKRLQEAMRLLFGDSTVQRRSEPATPSLMERIGSQLSTTCPITETVKRDYEIAADGFEKLLENLRLIVEEDLKKLGDELEAAGAPWTPGRGVPRWKKN